MASQLEQNTAALEAILASLGNPSGGSASSSKGKCTIRFARQYNVGHFYLKVANTSNGPYIDETSTDGNFTLSDVVCGSLVIVMYCPLYSCTVGTTGIELLHKTNSMPLSMVGNVLILRAPEEDGAEALVEIWDED